jgi:predicted nucleic acid-binding protein
MHFPDTSFLCALYRPQVNSPEADRFMNSLSGFLPVSSLILLEFRQSVRLQIHLHGNDRTRGFPRHEGEQTLRTLQTDLTASVIANVPVDWTDVHQWAERLSDKYTLTSGHRLADILHVATALHLGADEFLTFDANQKKLAEAECLHVPL